MSFFNRLFDQFIDVIAWTDDTGDTLVRRFEDGDNEIKHGAKLTVREGQAAVFVHEGRLADVFPPGLYKLKTSNLPILSTLQHWDHGFESPFKSEIYFVSTRRFTDLKWGTRHPVTLRDPEFGPVRLRAFGSYTMRVVEPGVFLREVVGTDGDFTMDEISNQLRNVIVARFSTAVATSRVPVVDLAANLEELGGFVKERIQPDIAEFGIEIDALYVENVSLPPEVERAIDRRASMGVVGDLRKYAQFQSAEAIRAAASTPNSSVGAGLGAAFGLEVGAASARRLGEADAPPPPVAWHVALGGAAQGPFDRARLIALAAEGKLTATTLVWRRGMAEWTRAAEVAELADLVSAAPPPLPPAG